MVLRQSTSISVEKQKNCDERGSLSNYTTSTIVSSSLKELSSISFDSAL